MDVMPNILALNTGICLPPYQFYDQRTDSDCFRCSLANLLGISYEDVPDFYGDELRRNGSPNIAWRNLQAWLSQRGKAAIKIGDQVNIRPLPDGVRAILSGKSPRNPDWDHSVLGEWRDGSWRLVHDPHLSRCGVVGPYHTITFVTICIP